MPDLTSPFIFTLCVAFFFIVLVLRYFITTGLLHLIFFVLGKRKWASRKLNVRPYSQNQLGKEIFWSMLTSAIFALSAALLALLWQQGWLDIYSRWDKYGIIYLVISLPLAMFIHDTYYYWVHRWMHKKNVFGVVHKVHHESLVTSAWTSFSFHPTEAVLQAAIVPLILLFMPMHVSVLVIWLLIMTFTGVANHLNIEIYPSAFRKSAFGKLVIDPTHHHWHHLQFRKNFGLYFTIWDRWMDTEHSGTRKSMLR